MKAQNAIFIFFQSDPFHQEDIVEDPVVWLGWIQMSGNSPTMKYILSAVEYSDPFSLQ